MFEQAVLFDTQDFECVVHTSKEKPICSMTTGTLSETIQTIGFPESSRHSVQERYDVLDVHAVRYKLSI